MRIFHIPFNVELIYQIDVASPLEWTKLSFIECQFLCQLYQCVP